MVTATFTCSLSTSRRLTGTAFRLIRYAVAAMQRHLEAGHEAAPVIPVLFYTGKRSLYPYSTRWLDEFDDPALAGTPG